jgi:hypothetical protein
MRQLQVVRMLCAAPPDVRAWIEQQATRNLANSTIVLALRQAMEAEQEHGLRAVRERQEQAES